MQEPRDALTAGRDRSGVNRAVPFVAVPAASVLEPEGQRQPDTAAVAEHIRSEGADLVALQEVQWHQARRLARALGATSRRWKRKHFPGRTWPEGWR